jgi:hypothetical protein
LNNLIANQLVRYLEARGVEHIFGLCGHTNIAVLAALEKSRKIKFVNTRHEQIARGSSCRTSPPASPPRRRASPTPRSTRFRWW